MRPAWLSGSFQRPFAKRVARTYRKRGLDPTQSRMVSFLIEHGIKGASVLEIGGGVGELQIELLSRGAREATNLEISRNYEAEAAALLAQSGMTDRVEASFRRYRTIARRGRAGRCSGHASGRLLLRGLPAAALRCR